MLIVTCDCNYLVETNASLFNVFFGVQVAEGKSMEGKSAQVCVFTKSFSSL